ncbi:DNA recombination protein RmuC [Rhodococcus sp. 1.20]
MIVISLTVQIVRERNNTVRERNRADLQHAKLSNYEAAFASSTGRGELGEVALRRTVTAAGLIEGVHFHLQRESSGSSQGRPDLTLVLGNDRHMMVDSKCVIEPYWDALDAVDDSAQQTALGELVRRVRKHANELRGRQYDSAGKDLTGVILFVPTDAVATAAISTDPTLWQDLAAKTYFSVVLQACCSWRTAHMWLQQEPSLMRTSGESRLSQHKP